MEKTTIQISLDTLKRLKGVKRFDRESYDGVINVLIDEYEDEELTVGEIEEIERALESIKKEGTVPIERVAKEMGISLD